MNYKNILILFVGLASCTVQARQEQELFLQAAHEYEAGDIADAYKIYKALPIKSAGTLYNMGNCAYRLHDYGTALGYWMQALLQAPRFMYPWLLSSIQATQEKLELPVLSSWQKAVLYMQSYLSLFMLQIITIVLFVVGIVLWFLKRLRWWYALLLILGISLSGTASYVVYRMWYAPHVIVVMAHTTMHAGPDEQFPVVQEIPLGMRAAVVGMQDSWYKISYLNKRGWIQQSHVMNIV